MALRAVRSLRALHDGDVGNASGAAPEGNGPEELAVTGATGDYSWANGLYCQDGTHTGKTMYTKVSTDDSTAHIYFHLVHHKWTIGEEIADAVFEHEDSSLPSPPLEQWTTRSGDAGPRVSVVPQLLLVGGTEEDSNGHYVRCENFNHKPLFRRVGAKGTVQFDGTEWKLHNRRGAQVARCEGADPVPPLGPWSGTVHVSVFEQPFPSVPRFMWVRGAGTGIVNGCYACTHEKNGKPRYVRIGAEGSIFSSDHPEPGTWKLDDENFGSGWYYRHSDAPSSESPPTTGWTKESCPGSEPPPRLHPQQKYSETFPADSASSAPSTQPSSPVPFLVVQGAGRAEVNGRYAYAGTYRDAPKYRQLGGTSIIFWTSGLWRLNHEENLNQRLYDGPADRTPLPTSGWDARHYPPAPTVSLGNHRDLQAGDRVKVVKSNDEVDWSRCPQSDRFTYALVPDSRTIARIEGDWWFNTYRPEAISSLAQLGEVEFNDCWHCISAVERSLGSSASAPARAFGTSTAAGLSQAARQEEEQSAEPESGFDEEWCPDQDLERFRCCICMSVARNAMVHECGAVLFCEMCWVRCQAESDNCPVCREDGSSMVPAHSDRRLIRNLMIMCPNKCGESFPLCEKDKHIQDSCQKRQVKCTSCSRSYDANSEEGHREECPARLAPCRLCGEEVRMCDMEAHFGSNPGRHIHLMVGLLDKMAALEAEVKKLKGEAE
eukprot:s602_g14.t1